MAKIDKSKLSKKITDTYSIEDNTFKLSKIKNAEKDIYKDEPKDEINIEVGDSKTPLSFIPQVKLMRWSNETNFSVRLIDDEVGTEKIENVDDKIIYEKGNKKVEFYEYLNDEGGYKLVWYLKKKPKTNKVEFTIQSKGLDFFYQPELTQEEKNEGAFRPENVIGSYAVYYSTKGGMVDANGKDYKCGKAFHIYRPHIIDASGAETWGILHIENGIYSVEIPQEFLDSAVYPIKSNDTFGYTGAGASSYNTVSANQPICDLSNNHTASTGDTITRIQISAAKVAVNGDPQVSVYSVVSGTPSAQLFSGLSISVTSTKNWYYVDTTQVMTNGVTYGVAIDDFITYQYTQYYDTGTGNNRSKHNGTAFPAIWSELNKSTTRYSIYATYTTGGGGGGAMSFTLTGVGHLT